VFIPIIVIFENLYLAKIMDSDKVELVFETPCTSLCLVCQLGPPYAWRGLSLRRETSGYVGTSKSKL